MHITVSALTHRTRLRLTGPHTQHTRHTWAFGAIRCRNMRAKLHVPAHPVSSRRALAWRRRGAAARATRGTQLEGRRAQEEEEQPRRDWRRPRLGDGRLRGRRRGGVMHGAAYRALGPIPRRRILPLRHLIYASVATIFTGGRTPPVGFLSLLHAPACVSPTGQGKRVDPP